MTSPQEHAETQPSTEPKRHPTRLICVLSEKGGVGKTTIAVNLAAMVAADPDLAERVLLVDVDQQVNVKPWLDKAGDLGFDHTSHTDPQLLSVLREQSEYDFVIVDTPGNLAHKDLLNVVVGAADFVVVPTDPAYLSIITLPNTIGTVITPHNVPYAVVLNQVLDCQREEVKQLKQFLTDSNIPAFTTNLRFFIVHKRAPNTHKVVTNYPRWRTHGARSDFTAFYQEFKKLLASAPPRHEPTTQDATTTTQVAIDVTDGGGGSEGETITITTHSEAPSTTTNATTTKEDN